MMFSNGGNWSFWEVALMWVGMIALAGLLVWVVFAVIERTRTSRHDVVQHHDEDPWRILDQRLARGDIDPDEHGRLRALLSSPNQHDHVHNGSRR